MNMSLLLSIIKAMQNLALIKYSRISKILTTSANLSEVCIKLCTNTVGCFTFDTL